MPLGDEVTVVHRRADADPYAVQAADGTAARGRGPYGAHHVVRRTGPRAVARRYRAGLISGRHRRRKKRCGPCGRPSGAISRPAATGSRTGRVAGRDTVALDGVGDDGLFHAAQTLRQLIGRRAAGPAVAGRRRARLAGHGRYAARPRASTDNPGATEQRLAQLDFMGRTKQNRYLYAPGDDAFRQARWRDPYPADAAGRIPGAGRTRRGATM